MDASMATAADSNKVAIVGDPRPPMMDGKSAFAVSGPATGLAKFSIPLPDPLAMTTEEPPIEPVSRIAAPAEAARRDRAVTADPAPQVLLPFANDMRRCHRLDRRHTENPSPTRKMAHIGVFRSIPKIPPHNMHYRV
jgi:hypothetical protein